MVKIIEAEILHSPTSICVGRDCWYCSLRSCPFGMNVDPDAVRLLVSYLRPQVLSGRLRVTSAQVSGGGETLLYELLPHPIQMLALLHPREMMLVSSGPRLVQSEMDNLDLSLYTGLQAMTGEVHLDEVVKIPPTLFQPILSVHDESGSLDRLATYLEYFDFPLSTFRYRPDPRAALEQQAEGIMRMLEVFMAHEVEVDVNKLKGALELFSDAGANLTTTIKRFTLKLQRDGRHFNVRPMEPIFPVGRARDHFSYPEGTPLKPCLLLAESKLRIHLGWNGLLCPCTCGNVFEQQIAPLDDLLVWSSAARTRVARALKENRGRYIDPCEVCPYWREPARLQPA